MWNGKHYCIDASKEDGTLGRLVNDDHIHPNCKVKRIMVKGRPHLCLFSIKEIFPGEEITFNYGDSSWPWRSVAPCEEPSDPNLTKSEPVSEKDVCDGVDMMAAVSSTPATSKDDTDVCDGVDMMAAVSSTPATSKDATCHHILTSAFVNALDHCEACNGPVSALRWLGYTCKLCSRSWHKSCFIKMNPLQDVDEHVSDSASSHGTSSGDLFHIDTESSCDGNSDSEDPQWRPSRIDGSQPRRFAACSRMRSLSSWRRAMGIITMTDVASGAEVVRLGRPLRPTLIGPPDGGL
ncbi:unnamed protein product [Gadus morhua 'NCC']